jgi:orotate phosphoribosyltransferase
MDETRRQHIARHSARILLETKSVLFNAAEPFTFTSGRISPVYTDCRRLISFVNERAQLMDFAVEMLDAAIGRANIDFIAGGETAGIPYAAFVAERMEKPMLYVRKKPKGFGRMAQIEGVLPEQGRRNVILVEDLQTDGGSKKVFIDALRAAGGTVEHTFVVFHYGIFPQSLENMKNMGLQLHALTTWWDVLAYARDTKAFDEATLASVEAFLHNPDGWAHDNAHKVKERAGQ